MDGETVKLKDHLEAKIDHLEKEFNLKIDSLKEATLLAKNTLDDRLEGMNEFREALKDQSTKFITKTEFDITINKICDDVKFLRESRAELKGKADQSQVNMTAVLSIIGLIVGVIGLLLSIS